MLKRSFSLLAALALVGFALPAQADAQATIYIGGGASFPTGEFGDYSNTGWLATGGVLVGVGPQGLDLGLELFYGQNNHKEEASFFENEKTSLYGAMAIVDYTFGEAGKIRPYVFGGLGILIHRFSAANISSQSDTNFGYEAGAGLAFPLGSGSTSLYVEGRYMGASGTNLFGLLAGFAFGVG